MLNNIQYLRGIAAVMVVAFHVLAPSARLDNSDAIPLFFAGQGGVDLFFVISGFIIWYTTRGGDAEPGRFLVRRLKRIVPLYWALTLLLAGIAIALPSVMVTTVFDPQHFIASLLFLPWPHPQLGEMNPVLFVGWSLNYEMAFYLVFALMIPFAPYVRGFLAVLFGMVIVGLGFAIDDGGIMDFYTSSIILEFLFGILIAMAFSTQLRLPVPVSIGLVAGGFIALFYLGSPDLNRVYWAGLPSLAIVTGAVFWEKERQSHPLLLPMLLGAASYAIYLSHVFVLPLCQTLWNLFLPEIAGLWIVIYAAGVSAACLVAGIATYLMLEIPLSHLADAIDDRLAPTARKRPPKRLTTRYLQALRP
ncbi:acyltransferase [Fulvimarina sp. MAC8]|uniref:acyltransferase family protein n=1 Tax=Fulvimarina sp. MAC8 TaxID=3162874 RepID=UPI0032F0442B